MDEREKKMIVFIEIKEEKEKRLIWE